MTPDRAVVRRAEAQHGAVSLAEALALGMTRRMVQTRVEALGWRIERVEKVDLLDGAQRLRTA